MGERWAHKSPKNMPVWDIEKTRLQEARRKRGIFDVSSEETEDLKVTLKFEQNSKECVVPSMLCVSN